jgi:hypothetical protein
VLAVFLHGMPDASFFLIAYGVVAAIALLGAALATVVFGRSGGAGRILAGLLAGTVAGFALACGLFIASMTVLAWMFKGVSAGPLLAAFVVLALGGGFAVTALVARANRPRGGAGP